MVENSNHLNILVLHLINVTSDSNLFVDASFPTLESSQVFSFSYLRVITLGMVYDSTVSDWQILIVSKSIMTLRNPEVVMLAPCNFELFVFSDWMIRIGSCAGAKREFTKSPQHFFSSPSQCLTSLNVELGTNLSLLTVR